MRGVLATLAAGSVATAAAAGSSNNLTCATGLYLLCGRPSGAPAISPDPATEPNNTTGVGFVATKIAAQIPGSIVAGIQYPATDPTPNGQLNLTAYELSDNIGAKATIDQVTAYHAACPDTKIALIGFSQGAQIISDALCGGIGSGGIPGAMFNTDQPLPQALVEQSVLAVALIADPTHIANTTYDVGNSTKSGVLARTNTTVCDAYSGFIQSYCQANDFFCDSGNSTDIHLAEAKTFEDDVVQFVVGKWNNFTAKNGSSGSPTTSGGGGASASPSPSTKPNAGASSSSALSQSLLFGAGALVAAWALL